MQLPRLVSCIMPTAGRENFVPFAIKYFQRQTYPNKELIVVDDGEINIEYLCGGENIHYYRMDKSQNTIGLKRNYACDVAKGEIIIHWDDDDWYAPDWIESQVNKLLASGADICGLSQLFFYSVSTNNCWKYIYPSFGKPWIGGATMAYLKSFWKKNPFKNVQIGEDNAFVWSGRGKVATHNHVDKFVSILHNKNTSPKLTSNSRWHKHEAFEVIRLLGNDHNNYLFLTEAG